MIQVEIKTELEEILIDRIRNMSIDQQKEALEFFDKSVPEKIAEEPEAEMSDLERRQKIVEIMRRLAARGGLMPGIDPLEWQREERKDRPLPGRED